MPYPADPRTIANQARRRFLQAVLQGAPAALRGVEEGLRLLAGQSAPPDLTLRRRDCLSGVHRQREAWEAMLLAALTRLDERIEAREAGQAELATQFGEFSLVDDDTIEREILASRLGLALMDLGASEFSDLRSRINYLERRKDMRGSDFLQPSVAARLLLEAWQDGGLDLETWRVAQPVLHEEFGHLLLQGYHETNRWLIERKVLPEIDLRPMIRRAQDRAPVLMSAPPGGGPERHARGGEGGSFASSRFGGGAGGDDSAMRRAYEETHLLTRLPGMGRPPSSAHVPLHELTRLVGEQVSGFQGSGSRGDGRPQASSGLQRAMEEVGQQEGRSQRSGSDGEEAPPTITALLDGLNERRQLLKRATESPIERATIEIVALLFQSILMEERLPASVRVWFARLQMPVLRVAISEPDFFATTEHPARKLIDRMGACVMGFDSGTAGAMGQALEREIKRVVQVVEAYPDTGRQVFQTVLQEFERFLDNYFRHENASSRVGVSLAQQVEQRETLAIQYTIELRRMLDEVPVQEGVRDFLFQIWADVLAMTAVKTGGQSEMTRLMTRAAADLIWSASAKVTREERAEVIRRLPLLLKTLREGMSGAGLPPERQDKHIQQLNNALAAAFTAKTAVIPSERLEELMIRLERLEELLPGGFDLELDEALVRDLSDHQSEELEVVGEGGSMPNPAMQEWARGLQVGQWFKLDYRGRNEAVQLAWQGLRKQLSLFVSPSGRCVLFPRHRLASFLQAGLLLPAEEETLTVRATREALAKLDADPSRLLN